MLSKLQRAAVAALILLAPALLLIMVWRTGDLWETANIPRLFMDHLNSGPRGSEVPEVLVGLCIIIYTFSNLKRARYLNRLARRAAAKDTPADREMAKERA